MPQRNILMVAVDGLRASALGAYGNTSFATPALDQSAGESFLLDSCFATAPNLAAVYRALWQSQHPLRPPAADAVAPSLPDLLSAAGYDTTLVTDAAELTSLVGAGDFDQCVQLASAAQADGIEPRAADMTQTSMARLFAAACDVVDAASGASPRIVWVHSRGMYGPWDAPLELQQTLLDEGDPPPVETVVPPDFFLGTADDPDSGFRYGCAYSAQVMVLDACWKGLIEAINSKHVQAEWLVVLVGLRGYSLGEHRRIGGVDSRMYAEQLHVPAIMRFPDRCGQLARSGELTTHLDLLPTLVEWIGADVPDQPAPFDGMSLLPLTAPARCDWRDALISFSPGSRAIRTAAWCLRQNTDPQEADADVPATPSELYVRPDDRWEANDVAKLCPDVVETLARAADETAQEVQQVRDAPLPIKIFPADTTATL